MIVHVHGPIPENMFEHFVTRKCKLCRRNFVARDGLPDRPIWIFGVGVLRAATVSSSALAGKENCNRKSSWRWPWWWWKGFWWKSSMGGFRYVLCALNLPLLIRKSEILHFTCLFLCWNVATLSMIVKRIHPNLQRMTIPAVRYKIETCDHEDTWFLSYSDIVNFLKLGIHHQSISIDWFLHLPALE